MNAFQTLLSSTEWRARRERVAFDYPMVLGAADGTNTVKGLRVAPTGDRDIGRWPSELCVLLDPVLLNAQSHGAYPSEVFPP